MLQLRSPPAQPARKVVCRTPPAAKRQRLSTSPVCSAAVAASPSKQGGLSVEGPQAGPTVCASDVNLTSLVYADKEVFQHDGALEEIDEDVYHIIKQEKGRQVRPLLALQATSPSPSHFDQHMSTSLNSLQVHGLELIASENFTSRAVCLELHW